MKAALLSLVALLGAQFAKAQTAPAERELYYCHSDVQNFEEFRVMQLTTQVGDQNKVSYQVRTGFLMFEETWNQSGDAQINSTDPIFAGQFSKKVTIPPPETDPADPNPPQGDEEEYFIYVSIDKSGSGSLSVDADLQPITCTRSF